MTTSAAHDNTKRYWETSDFWKDAGERVVSSFLFAFVGFITLAGFDLSDGRAWGGAAIAAALSTVKAIIGAQKSQTTTPVSIL